MAMPANVTTVVVLGTFLTPEGEPSTGTVSFTPSSWLLNSGANIAIPNSTVTKTLGTAGNFSVTLPITDDPDLSPGGWIYTVSEVVDGVSQSYNIAIPGTVAAGGTVFLADLAPVAPAGPEYYSLASSLTVGTVSTLPAGSAATATITGLAPSQVLNLGIPTGPQGTTGATGATGPQGPQGATGPTGPQGSAATIAVGTVTSGTAGGTPSVTNSGTSGAAVLDFVLIPGNTGPQGATGAPGAAASVTVGSVTTVPFGGTAAVTNSGTSGSAVLDFVLVTGPQGDLAGLSANAPLRYISNTFSLNTGAGLTTSGTVLVADLSSTAAAALGTAGAAGTATQIARADHVHEGPTLSSATPTVLGTATAGTATAASRGDHRHAMPSASDVGAVANSLVANSKGALITSTGSAVAALTVGTNGHVLTADSAATNGIKWAAPASGSDIDPLFLAGV